MDSVVCQETLGNIGPSVLLCRPHEQVQVRASIFMRLLETDHLLKMNLAISVDLDGEGNELRAVKLARCFHTMCGNDCGRGQSHRDPIDVLPIAPPPVLGRSCCT